MEGSPPIVEPAELAERLDALWLAPGAEPLLAVDLTVEPRGDAAGLAEALGTAPCVTVGVAAGAAAAAPSVLAGSCDVLLTDEPAVTDAGWVHTDVAADLAALAAAVRATPIATRMLSQVLRFAERRDVEAGLLAESTAYSTLLAGPEFAAWLAAQPSRAASTDESRRVRAARDGDVLRLTLDRREARNAFDARMREELVDLLAAACADATVQRVVLDGAGPAFCAGGDLREFGTAADPASAHLIRTDRSPGRLLARLGTRAEARVHGACIGAGIELPAFAGRLLATADSRFALPEAAMGLIPGAGGTVSLPRRIGRQRTAYIALLGGEIGVETALAWGLVDDVCDRGEDVH